MVGTRVVLSGCEHDDVRMFSEFLESRTFFYVHLPSLELTPVMKIGLPDRNLIFQPSFFGGYVSFREGTSICRAIALSGTKVEEHILGVVHPLHRLSVESFMGWGGIGLIL